MKIMVPELSLVVLIGPSGSGKSTFAQKHFRATEVVSSDFCRALVADDQNDLSATADAFDVLHYIAAKRLSAGKLAVVDATNVRTEDRKPLVELARQYHCMPVAIVFDLPLKVCQERNRQRTDRRLGDHVPRQQQAVLRRSLRRLEAEGFRHVYILSSPEEADEAAVERTPLWTNRRQERGPFDIIGDVHGCFDELRELLQKLGYDVHEPSNRPDGIVYQVTHPSGRRVVFLGDLADRGPNVPNVLRLVMDMVGQGLALCVMGNHESKLLRKLKGRDVQVSHGMEVTLAQLKGEPPEFTHRLVGFLDGLLSHYVLDDGNLVVAHAGLKEDLQGRASRTVREFAMYGETTGETDEFGLPVRYNWAEQYRGRSTVVYGHSPVPEPEWLNRTINVDTGCAFGGRLTALRYPEKQLVSVPAKRVYYQPVKPFQPAPEVLAAEVRREDVLDIKDVLGKRVVRTRLHGNVVVREENATAALEVMSRFALDPRWLIYLPPTMSPPETSQRPGLLEHPAEAFAYYRRQGIRHVVCEEKHMGSRVIAIVCRDSDVTRKRFRIVDDRPGVAYTRTGRPFFEDPEIEREVLSRLSSAMEASGLWDHLNTDWICLDCELMPWSAKAQELLREQYAAVGSAARAALGEALNALEGASERHPEARFMLDGIRDRVAMVNRYVEAYRRYCWPVRSVDDFKLAPFHIMAAQESVFVDKSHQWHLETLAKLCEADRKLLLPTGHVLVDLDNPADQAAATAWWERLTEQGGEGMVVKPLEFVARGRRGLVQPAVKCRGPEYLRIIYGPEYTAPQNLERLRDRGLAQKRSLALREFALGIESLERFVGGEPLYRVHECVFGVLAMESEPVDPRL